MKKYIAVELGATKCQTAVGTPDGILVNTDVHHVILEQKAGGILSWLE